MDATRQSITFTLNRRRVSASVSSHETVIEVLQRDFGLFGARESCGLGVCGCCTILVDGTPVSGCLHLAAFVDGAELLTVEGLANPPGTLHPIQQAFIEKSGFQCGFCTPGFIMMTKALLEQNPHPTDDEIRHHLSGNLCRCATYLDVVEAVKDAARKLSQPSPDTAV